MSPAQKKRSSAFEDFPAGAEGQPAPAPAPAPAQAAPARPPQEPQVERIERLKPSQMLPDRFQPRRLLPSAIRGRFFAGAVDCYQAASEWLAMTKNDPSAQAQVERLLAMGDSFTAHGQIKPITGSWAPASDGRYIFIIETGERRFWAACLQAVRMQRPEEPLLRVEVIAKPTRQRQVLENRHAEMPSAVGQACEVAALILAELGIPPDPSLVDEYDYFRQAYQQRMPAGLWERLTPVMQLTRTRMVQLLNILNLPTPLLEQADRARLPERVLREILALPRPQREQVLRFSIQNQSTSDDLAEMIRPAGEKKSGRLPRHVEYDTDKAAMSGLRRFAAVIMAQEGETGMADAIVRAADTLVVTGEAERMAYLLGALIMAMKTRLSRMGPR